MPYITAHAGRWSASQEDPSLAGDTYLVAARLSVPLLLCIVYFAKGNREGRRGVVSIHQYVQCDCIEYTMHSTYRMIPRDCSATTECVGAIPPFRRHFRHLGAISAI